jgi:choice-of-anchor C domain-containing protein
MKAYFSSSAVLAAFVASASPAFAAVNLVSNGSFEAGANPGSFTTLGTGSGSLTAWTIASGNIDYIGTYWQASQGVRSLDMNGSFVAGTITQLITGLQIGKTYNFSFDIAGNPDGPPPTKSLDATINGNTYTAAFPVGANTKASMGWSTYSTSFVAGSTSTLLSFTPNGDPLGAYGPALDNVSVSAAVPEPATWAMMLLGLVGLGFMSRRRKPIGVAA